VQSSRRWGGTASALGNVYLGEISFSRGGADALEPTEEAVMNMNVKPVCAELLILRKLAIRHTHAQWEFFSEPKECLRGVAGRAYLFGGSGADRTIVPRIIRRRRWRSRAFVRTQGLS